MENTRLSLLLAIAIMLTACAAVVWAQADEERALEVVRERIEAIQRRLAAEQADRDTGAVALRQAELDAATATRELERLRAAVGEQRARANGLALQTRTVEARLSAERVVLGRQLRASYVSGQSELFRLLLSQEDPAQLGRMVVYYNYLLRDRAQRIDSARSELAELAELADESERVARSLADLERAQATEVAALETARSQRAQTLAALESSIAAADAEVSRLRAEEQRLVDLIDELGELVAGFPVNTDDPFTGMQGRLAWPVAGTISGDFGRPREGGPVRWNGVLLEAGQGTPVRAVYHGRVVFSDWLPGLGLLIILDHGDGYMSLYGHNEALLKDSGDWATPGEVIAQVGDTGGLARPSLYFEIRRNGSPVNPHPWFASAPAGR